LEIKKAYKEYGELTIIVIWW